MYGVRINKNFQMKKRKTIYYIAIVLLILIYYIATATGYDALAFFPIVFFSYWIMLNLLSDKQIPN